MSTPAVGPAAVPDTVPSSPHDRTSASPPSDIAPADAVAAVLTSALVLAVYLGTMYPGLHDVGDAAKFSFVGKVLGTPHSPGYPLYVMVSHLFSYVPWGTLAYRMNALSAVLGAVAVGLTYLTVRSMGGGRAVSAAAALGLGFGAHFWSRAIYAKGYTLNAALVAGGTLALLRWDRTRRMRDLYVAAGIFALSLGNHLIVIALVPALVLFPLLTAPRQVLRPKPIAVALVLVLLGLCQYGFIIVRTRQHALYLEAKATNVSELWRVMTARRFGHEIGAFSPSILLNHRLPHIGGMVVTELGTLGVPLVAIGFAVLAVRQRRRAVLLGLGAIGVAGLTANMGSQEDEGFMLPVFVLLWPVAGVGLAFLVSWLGRRAGPIRAGAAMTLCALLPASLVAANYERNDRHAETRDIEYFDALFAALPDKAAIVDDEYRVNMMILYKLLGERAGGHRDIRLIGQDRDQIAAFRRDGFAVLAFNHARASLRQYGFRFVPFEDGLDASVREVLHSRPIFRLLSEPVCFDVGNRGWTDVGPALRPSGRATIRIDNYRAFDSDVLVYAGMQERITPALIGPGGAGVPSVEVEVFDRADAEAARALQSRLDADGAVLPMALSASPMVARFALRVNDKGAYFTSAIDFGGALDGAVMRARVDLDNPKRATFCSHPLAEVDAWPASVDRADVALEGTHAAFADGWHALERRADGQGFRWTSDRATLVLPLASPRAATLTLTAEPFSYPGRPRDATITLIVNGRRVGDRALPDGWRRLTWDVSVDLWRRGLNGIEIEVAGARRPSAVGRSSDQRVLGAAIARIEIGVPAASSR